MLSGVPRDCAASGNAADMLIAAARDYPDRVVMKDAASGETVTFGELSHASLAISTLIRSAGIRPGERVALLFERGIVSAAAYFATLAAGAVAVPVNETLKSRQIDYILEHSGAQLLLTAGRTEHLSQSPMSDVPILEISDTATLPLADREALMPRVGADAAHIIYTSGSTGMPKGIVVSHANVCAGADAVISYLSIGKNDRIASLLPFSFDYGLNQLLCAVRAGAALIVERTPVPQRIVDTIFKEEVTVLPAVPPLWLQLLSVRRFREQQAAGLRVMTNTGGRIPTEAVRQLRAAQPNADLVLMYGLTEAFRSTWLHPDRVDEKPDSIGRAIPGAQILVLHDDQSPCAPGEVGQLVHRGPTVAMGYWNDPDSTAACFRPNPLRPAGTPDAERVVFSGDLVRMDEDGDIYFVGRRDAMIKSLGHRVSPDEVADVLYASGEVVEAAVAAEADAMRGDAIIAHIVLKGEGDLDRLKRYAAKELPRYMQPVRYYVRDALARTSSGKHDVRAMAEAGEYK